jgi:hypothetical protein
MAAGVLSIVPTHHLRLLAAYARNEHLHALVRHELVRRAHAECGECSALQQSDAATTCLLTLSAADLKGAAQAFDAARGGTLVGGDTARNGAGRDGAGHNGTAQIDADPRAVSIGGWPRGRDTR